MEKVILTLNKQGSISALESPTGTGKTLCLLCAVLAWVKHYNKKISIYYCTRTVSQINNVLKELDKTCYKINTSFVASRKFTCIKFAKSQKKEIDSTQIRVKCETLRDNYFKKKGLIKILEICEYYKTNDNYKNLDKNKNFVDIEDLLKYGKDKKFCPYFYNIHRSKYEANLTIMTYNYILNPYIRRRLNIVENNSIIILDEAHNICEKFEDNDSNKINTNDLEKIQILLGILLDFVNENKEEYYLEDEEINQIFMINAGDLNKEINKVKEFIKNVDKLNLDKFQQYKEYGDSKKDSYIVDVEFFKERFKNFKIELFEEITQRYYTLKEKDKKELDEFYKKGKLDKSIKLLNKLNEFLNLLKSFEIIKKDEDSTHAPPSDKINTENLNNSAEIKILKEKYIKIVLDENKLNSFRFIYTKKEDESIFEIICIDPSYGLKEYLEIKPYSTLLTSGTLSINSIEKQLKVKFNETLNNEHVINNEQFKINIIKGYNKNKIYNNYSFTYKNKKDKYQISSLGEDIFNLANSVTIGRILVFFQSFEYLNECHKIRLNQKLIEKFEKIKDVFFDLSFNKDYGQETIMKLKKNNNLILFTVYRGVNSEGLNFPDDEARMVICVGVPFQNLSDIKVQLKGIF